MRIRKTGRTTCLVVYTTVIKMKLLATELLCLSAEYLCDSTSPHDYREQPSRSADAGEQTNGSLTIMMSHTVGGVSTRKHRALLPE